ncbi:beta-Ala-His dipeptidase [Selenomonas sp. F0473]|uniref:beta-Ala-His dipeptidase n=1 Tax=Selenomonas sp. F0473 TaxID=999423 RepID=UPI00029E1C8B|nr:beta-Ala-His dipeptidase [Selenomonas sp. F0473]EKU71864.1 aminoacyl-histidine dipeptidase [Selenomonas sp. F0473]
MTDDKKLLETVIAEFEALTHIPRPSGHERAVSDYLKKRFAAVGCTVTQDEHWNIIAELPASAGHEHAPLTILQGHMDMVCVAAPGVSYDPVNDPIKMVRTAEFISAEGTSLGGDDGIGVAEILAAFQYAEEHGPLRAIVTVDEEVGMTGAQRLDPAHLEGAKYLINCDSEDYHIMTVGSAGSVNLDYARSLTRAEQECPAYRIEVRGLLGGHSGERIDAGRGNAIRTLALALRRISENGRIALADFSGGVARNAIPSAAAAVIYTEMGERELCDILVEEEKRFRSIYGAADPGMKFALAPVRDAGKAIGAEEQRDLLALLTILRTGVYEMSRLHAGLVETSANLGVVAMDEYEMRVAYFPRSSVNEQLDEIVMTARAAAELTGFNLCVGTQSPAWRENEKSELARIMGEVYAAQNGGKAMTVESIHAGLETSWHAAKNPGLDMVSIGVTAHDIHTPNERIEVAAIVPETKLMMETLRRIAK